MDGSETTEPRPRGETQAEADARVKAAFDAYTYGRTMPGENGHPDKPKPLDEITPLWEAMWEAADFSWASLANARWDRGREANPAQLLKRWRAPMAFPGDGKVHGEGDTAYKEATLQDYWRFVFWLGEGGDAFSPWDPGAIDDAMAGQGLLQTRPDGRVFHAVHCPNVQVSVAFDAARDNSTSLREAAPSAAGGIGGVIAALNGLLKFALEAASAYGGDNAPDGRVQLNGVRAGGIDWAWRSFFEGGPARRLHISVALSDLTGLNGSLLTFGDRADFSRATLGEGVKFIGATLGEGASFSSAMLGDRASFLWATLGDRADFSGATLGEGASLSSAKLGDRASFLGATLGDRANFFAATFGDRADFSGAMLGDRADFSRATLGDFAGFPRATLGEGADFSKATFGEWAYFFRATLGDSTSFFQATLGDNARFVEATLGEGARFSEATFGNGATFSNATLGDRADFSSSTLEGHASWARAVFRGVSDFSGVTWHVDTHYGGAFDSARFEDFANFKTANFSAFSALHDATFKQRLLLQPPSDGQRPDDLFRAAKAAAEKRIKAEIAKIADWTRAEDETEADFKARKKAAPDEIRDRVWSELSGGYRTAKKAMEAVGDFDREQTFYRFEVQARTRRPRINPGERLAAWFYRVFSDYGASVARPFVWLIAFILGFAGVYLLMAVFVTERPIEPPFTAEAPYHRFGDPAAPTWEALELSINNAFRPLSALSTDEPREDRRTASCRDCSVSDALLFHEDGWVRFTVKALAILQSLLSFVLAFLFALAVRRKFQIS